MELSKDATHSSSSSSAICCDEMRDVWTRILPFMINPSPWRLCSSYTKGCWDHALYLEGEMPCPWLTPSADGPTDDEGQSVPILLRTPSGLIRHPLSTGEPSSSGDDMLVPKSNTLGQDTSAQIKKWKLHLVNMERITVLPDELNLPLRVVVIEAEVITELLIHCLPNCSKILGDFLTRSKGLTRVELIDLPEVTSLGDNCLYSATNLKFVTLSRIPKLERIGSGFLDNCSKLLELQLLDLPLLRDFSGLDNNVALKKLDLGSGLLALRTCGRSFLTKCGLAEAPDFGTHFPSLEVIQDFWFHTSTSVMGQLKLVGLKHLVTIEDCCFGRCDGVEHCTVTDLPSLTSVGMWFLGGAVGVHTVEFGRLPVLKKIHQYFFRECTSLKEASFFDLPELEEVGGMWLKGCGQVPQVTLRGLPKLTSVPDDFMLGTSCSDMTVEGCHPALMSLSPSYLNRMLSSK